MEAVRRMRTLVLGGGYSGGHVAARLRDRGDAVLVSHRSLDDRPLLKGVEHVRFDPDRGIVPSAEQLGMVDRVLVTIPPDRQGRDPVLEHLGPTLGRLAPRWLGYLSTTGVYGDTKGAWVDETSPLRPANTRSRHRMACEQAWQASGLTVTLLRLPGIYGPGRSPFGKLATGQGRLLHKPGQVFSRIHVDDICGAVLLAMEREGSDVVNVSDDLPCPSSEQLAFAAHLAGCRLPPCERFEEACLAMGPMALSFWRDNRRVGNGKLRQLWGYRLRFPTYREGLRHCLAAERAASQAAA